MLLQKKSAKSLGAAPMYELSMARTSANYIGPFSTNTLIRPQPDILPDIRYPAFGLAGYPAISVSVASLKKKLGQSYFWVYIPNQEILRDLMYRSY
jgi:hypothetical protein